jgi:hypothetical protein
MTDVRRVAISLYVACPLELRGISVSGTDISRLKLLQLLLCSKFVRLLNKGQILTLPVQEISETHHHEEFTPIKHSSISRLAHQPRMVLSAN